MLLMTSLAAPVADPYRWLEDADDPEVREWTRAQHEIAMNSLNSLAGRDTFERRLREVWDFPKYEIPRKRGDKLFYMRNDGLLAQPVLYVKEGDEPVRVLVNPNELSDDGTVAIFDWQPTSDGRLVMYALSDAGLDWVRFRFRDVESGARSRRPAWKSSNSPPWLGARTAPDSITADTPMARPTKAPTIQRCLTRSTTTKLGTRARSTTN